MVLVGMWFLIAFLLSSVLGVGWRARLLYFLLGPFCLFWHLGVRPFGIGGRPRRPPADDGALPEIGHQPSGDASQSTDSSPTSARRARRSAIPVDPPRVGLGTYRQERRANNARDDVL